jgi:hypothetical protein
MLWCVVYYAIGVKLASDEATTTQRVKMTSMHAVRRALDEMAKMGSMLDSECDINIRQSGPDWNVMFSGVPRTVANHIIITIRSDGEVEVISGR